MSDMEESVTRSLTHEFVEQPEPSLDGEWHQVSLADLTRAGWTHIAFHYPADRETPDAANLYGEAS